MKNTPVNGLDPRIIKTKKSLIDAFKELLLVYDDFMNISVKELCDHAGVSRKTFYLHYNQVDDLLSEVQQEYIEEFYRRTKDLDFIEDAEKVVKVYFDMNNSSPLYKKAATASVYFYTKEFSRIKALDFFAKKGKIFIDENCNPTVKDFLFHYYDMTIYIMYKRWVTKKYPLSEEEAIALTAHLIKHGISSLNS